MTRRHLFYAALAGAPIPAMRGAAPARARFEGMIARVALIDDVVHLAVWDRLVAADAAAALTRYEEVARLGVDIPVGDRPSEPAALAVWLGARISKLGEGWGLAEDASVLWSRSPRAGAAQAEIARALEAIEYRCRIALHTLDPDESDIHRWLEGIAIWRRSITAYKSRLAEAVAAGGSSFADAADPLVALAHASRRGRTGLAPALTQARPTSPYGRAIAAALAALRA